VTTSTDRFATGGVGNVFFFVDDLEAAVTWYSARLGRDPVTRGGALVAFDLNGTTLTLHQHDDLNSPGPAGTSPYWTVEDVDAVVDDWTSNGATVHRGPKTVFTGERLCQLLDPFGNLFSVRQVAPGHDPAPASGTSAVTAPHTLTADEAVQALPDRASAFYSALQNEHFVLESARSITVSESSSRASLYLTTLSSALVAFGFLARTDYALAFLTVIIPVVFLLGLFTYERLLETSLEDVAALESIQRIRGVYATLMPGAGRYFPRPTGPHGPNEMLPIGRRASWIGVFFTTATAIATVNSIVAGAGVAIITVQVLDEPAPSIVIGLGTAAFLALLHGLYQEYRYASLRSFLQEGRG
jgi:predicted enzyme related to lactoylglutathione lyase